MNPGAEECSIGMVGRMEKERGKIPKWKTIRVNGREKVMGKGWEEDVVWDKVMVKAEGKVWDEEMDKAKVREEDRGECRQIV
jgi:hypothetical protein